MALEKGNFSLQSEAAIMLKYIYYIKLDAFLHYSLHLYAENNYSLSNMKNHSKDYFKF